MALEFTTAKRRRDPIKFTLDDRVFSFDPPKSAVLILPVLDSDDGNERVMLKSTFDWLGAGLPEEDVEHIMDRLRDPEDDLDVADLGLIVRALSEEISGRPTT